MALLFIGLTKCGICDKVLNSEDQIVALPASSFINHPLYKYFDQGFHQECFDNLKDRDEIMTLIEKDKN